MYRYGRQDQRRSDLYPGDYRRDFAPSRTFPHLKGTHGYHHLPDDDPLSVVFRVLYRTSVGDRVDTVRALRSPFTYVVYSRGVSHLSYWIMVPIAAAIGYLLGSIPVGLWVCRFYGVDIRTVGSGRTGGTNAWRAAGLKAAVPTVIGDAVKGALAVWLVRWLFYRAFS